ncbi:DUF551 domain-containing protein [Enterobacter roggenkampii]|uniref:DUF551 domain-containing protein n=1 Tax=Enterobacter roggenkampii TaxID=1812935 RepID=A0AAX1WJ07_9ENTR|nr:DUF551 domain-containing protein [Enterobacter roggenkampii]RNT38152.1 DUF551 domain-containing protein [Enterobacter roggenkampii]
MSNIDKEWLKQKIADMEAARDEILFGLDEDDSNTLAALRIALASLEAKSRKLFTCSGCGAEGLDEPLESKCHCNEDGAHWVESVVYTAPPAPVSVPEHIRRNDADGWLMYKGRRVGGGCAEWYNRALDDCRAAMLQGADVSLTHEGKNHHEDKLGMVNHLGDVTEKVEPVTQIEPVADLYGLTSSTGGETSFTFDAVEARDFIDGGWSCQEYVELERFQEAVSGNSPVIQDGWVACVERMPSAGEKVLAYRPDAPESNDPLIRMATYVGGSAHGHGFDCYCKPTHWMPLPAAPKQELK